MRSAAATRSCATSSSPRSSTRSCVGARSGWEPRYLALRDAARACRGRHRLRQRRIPAASSCSTSPGRGPYERGGRALLPEADVRGSVHARDRTAAAVRARARAARGQRAAARGARTCTAAPRASRECTRCFSTSRRARPARERGWLLRRDCQFQWSNRGYASFEDYLQPSPRTSARRRGASAAGCDEAGRALRDAHWRRAQRGGCSSASIGCTATPSCATATSRT